MSVELEACAPPHTHTPFNVRTHNSWNNSTHPPSLSDACCQDGHCNHAEISTMCRTLFNFQQYMAMNNVQPCHAKNNLQRPCQQATFATLSDLMKSACLHVWPQSRLPDLNRPSLTMWLCGLEVRISTCPHQGQPCCDLTAHASSPEMGSRRLSATSRRLARWCGRGADGMRSSDGRQWQGRRPGM